jgi:hypothetical protein
MDEGTIQLIHNGHTYHTPPESLARRLLREFLEERERDAR